MPQFPEGDGHVSISRRRFLEISGLLLAGFTLKPAHTLLAAHPPLSSNNTGKKRWAMLIEVNACTDEGLCRACAAACHQVHNVPSYRDPKREIKWIWSEPFAEVFPEQVRPFTAEADRKKPVLVLCNHCDNPPCVPVCPTKATFKREEDGIVMMDYHRCIGCRYCMAACPYGARSFNWSDPRPSVAAINQTFPTRTKGVVEKCNFCEERLAKNQMPACVDAARGKGLYFGDLKNPSAEMKNLLDKRFVLQRRPSLGTGPNVYYLV